jgi:hypothetical protein
MSGHGQSQLVGNLDCRYCFLGNPLMQWTTLPGRRLFASISPRSRVEVMFRLAVNQLAVGSTFSPRGGVAKTVRKKQISRFPDQRNFVNDDGVSFTR